MFGVRHPGSRSGEMADDVEFHAHVRLVVMLGNKFFMSRNEFRSIKQCCQLLCTLMHIM